MLGTVDFSGVKELDKLIGTFTGQTAGWEAKPSKDGQSTNVIITFELVDGEGNNRKHTEYYNLKPSALWRIKRDLIAMGAEPSQFESTNVDLESILNGLCSPPGTQVQLTFVPDKDDPNGRFSDLATVKAV